MGAHRIGGLAERVSIAKLTTPTAKGDRCRCGGPLLSFRVAAFLDSHIAGLFSYTECLTCADATVTRNEQRAHC